MENFAAHNHYHPESAFVFGFLVPRCVPVHERNAGVDGILTGLGMRVVFAAPMDVYRLNGGAFSRWSLVWRRNSLMKSFSNPPHDGD